MEVSNQLQDYRFTPRDVCRYSLNSKAGWASEERNIMGGRGGIYVPFLGVPTHSPVTIPPGLLQLAMTGEL